VGYYVGPMLYSGTSSSASSSSSAITAEVGSFAYQQTVATKLHRFGRLGYIPRPVLMACMFGIAGMVTAPITFVGQDVIRAFRR
jgi:hypothetical protein